MSGLIAAGGTPVSICRGGALDAAGELSIRSPECTPQSRCVVQAYGAGPRALLLGAMFTFYETSGYTIAGLNLQGSPPFPPGAGEGIAIKMEENCSDIDVRDVRIDSYNTAFYNHGHPCNDRVRLLDSEVTNNSVQGFLGGGGVDSMVNNTLFSNNGFGTAGTNKQRHNIYWGGDCINSNRAIISHNKLYKTAHQDGKCNGVGLVSHGWFPDMLVEHNYIEEDLGMVNTGCWGMSFQGGPEDRRGWPNITIRSNTIVNVGRMSIGCGSCSGVIENNVIIQQQPLSSATAIGVPEEVKWKGGDKPGDLHISDITIRSNSIWMRGKDSSVTAIRIGGMQLTGGGYQVVSNAVAARDVTSFTCLDIPKSNFSAFTHIDHNVCDSAGVAATEWDRGAGSSPDPLAAWKEFTGGRFGSHSAAGELKYLSPDTPDADLRVPAGSAAIGAGDPSLSSPIDFNGDARGDKPDAGAFQFRG